jgi:hypothetical protein
LFKAVLLGLIGSAIGLGTGWMVHQSRYGVDVNFGPFTVDGDVTAANVDAFLRTKVQSGAPRVEIVGGEEHDFGVMEPNSKGEHAFVVKNTGEYPLSLEVIGSTCKCTIGELEKSELAPGEETQINLAWEVKSAGEDFGQSATLKTNDPTRGELSLKIKGKVISQMTMVPRNFSFGEAPTGEPVVLESIVYNFMKEPVVPTSQKFSDEALNALSTFEVTEIPMSENSDATYASATQAFKVRGVIRPGAPQGAVQQNFIFGFVDKSAMGADGKHEPEDAKQFVTQVTGKIVGAITLVESSRCHQVEGGYIYTIGRVDPATAKGEKANVMLRGKYKDSLKLRLGDVEPAGILQAELGEPVGRGSILLYPLKLWVAPETKSGEWLGKSDDDYGVVWIRTDNPDVSPLRLRVRFAVAK